MNKDLYQEFNRILQVAKKGMITVQEANKLMLEAINNYDFYGLEKNVDIAFNSKIKAYHKMYKLLFDITKGR